MAGSDGDFCLRQWHAGMSQTRLIRIHQLLQQIRQCGFDQIPVPVPAHHFQSIVESDGRLWQLEPWMPGQANLRDRPTTPRIKSAMHAIARWHLAAAAQTRDPDGPAHAIAVRSSLIRDYQRRLHDFEVALSTESHDGFREAGIRVTSEFRRLYQRVLARVDSVRDVVVPVQFCIRDLRDDHLLFTDDELTGLIDFGAVRLDTVSSDLSRLLGSLFGSDAGLCQKALAEYETVRPLTEGESSLFRPLDESGVLLGGMTWLKRRYEDNVETPDLDRISVRLAQFVNRMRDFSAD